MVRLFTIIVHLSALRMKGVSVISSSNVQPALQKISKSLIPLVLLFLTFVGVLSSSSLSVDAAQTESGVFPDSGVISTCFVNNNTIVQSPDGSYYGGSVIYSVLPETEYYIRARLYPSSVRYTQYIHFFRSYPALGSSAFSDPVFFSRDPSTSGNYIISNFTTPSYASYAVVTFRFDGSYSDVRSFLEGATIGSTLGLYSPLSNQSKIELNASFDISFLVTCSASGGVGSYRFNIDVIHNSHDVKRLYTSVSAGEYFISILSVDDNSVIRVTASDSLGNSSVKNFDIDSLPEFVKQLPPPKVDTDYIPETSISVDNGVADIIVDSFSVIPSEITALLIPVVLFSLIGWWLHK